jgi:hypothetical protein
MDRVHELLSMGPLQSKTMLAVEHVIGGRDLVS